MDQKLIQDIIEWDVRNWSQALFYWDNIIARDGLHGRCLELGARDGGLSLWLALKGMEVICSDLRSAESRASALHQKYGVASRIQYLDIDATNIPFENHFDIIAFKSVLGGVAAAEDRMDRQQLVIDQIFKALKPGGRLLFAENAKSTRLHAWLRKSPLRGYVIRWRYVALHEMRSFFQQYSACDLHTLGLTALFGRTESQRNLLGLLDQHVFDRIVPKTWKYIVYGMATK